MLAKSRAIVLSALKYGDSSLILRTYTETHGVMSFIAGGYGPKKKGPVKPSMALPLVQLNLVYYEKGKGSLKRIKEAAFYGAPYAEVGIHPVKNCMALFLAELLAHVLHEEEANPALFSFLSTQLRALDEATHYANLHLHFCFGLTAYLGFAPTQNSGPASYFDLVDGTPSLHEPAHTHYITAQVWEDWQKVQSQGENTTLKLSSERRNRLLDALLLYYRHHVKDFGTLKSVEVIQSVLH